MKKKELRRQIERLEARQAKDEELVKHWYDRCMEEIRRNDGITSSYVKQIERAIGGKERAEREIETMRLRFQEFVNQVQAEFPECATVSAEANRTDVPIFPR